MGKFLCVWEKFRQEELLSCKYFMNGVGFVDLLFVSQVQDKPKCFKFHLQASQNGAF